MKNNRLSALGSGVLVIHVLILAIVVTTGILAWQRLNLIVSDIGEETRPDYQLVIMKEILTNLSHAESSVKSYNLTERNSYLTEFYTAVQNTEEKLEMFRARADNDTLNLQAVDSLQYLVEQKFVILDGLLKVRDEYRVKKAMEKVIEKIRHKPSQPQIDTVITEAEEKKRGFFARIFGGKKKQTEEQADTTIVIQQSEPQEAIDEISENVQAIKDRETAMERQMNARELALLKEDNLVMEKIRRLLETMEAWQLEQLAQRSGRAESLIAEIRLLITVFVISAVVLLLMAAIAIYNYIRKNNQYEKVLKDARLQAEEHALEKERFLANMSHEIRTPMNAITGFTSQLLQTSLDPGQFEQLTIIKKAGAHLMTIINEILDFSRLQAGKLELRNLAFRPAEIFDEVAHLMKPSAGRKGLNFITQHTAGDTPVLKGDPVRLRQILLNLMSNAIKNTEIGEVRMSMASHALEEKKIQLSLYISDTGVGMPQSFLDKIFGEYQQTGTSAGDPQTGTGLGLAITKKLIDLHQGSIVINSTPGQGTSVSVNIPYQTGSETDLEKEKPSAEPAVDISGMHFLIVDDEVYNRKLIANILLKHKATWREAGDGLEAVRLTRENTFDLVLMDIRMPNMNGLEATAEIKKLHPRLPVLALTAAVTDFEQEKYKDAGMDAVLPKPFPEEDFFKVLAKIFFQKSTLQSQFAETEKPATTPMDLPDFAELQKLSNGNSAFFNEMLDTYMETARQNINEMKKALNDNDFANVGEAAHRMRASTKHIGAGKLLNILRDIEEKCLHAPDEKKVPLLVELADAEVARVLEHIKKSKHGND